MEIVTPRLTLRPLGPEYLASTHAYASDPVHTRYMMYLPHESEAETLGFLEDCAREWSKSRPAFYEFAVLLDGAHVGGVSLYREGDDLELAWIIAPDHLGHGYAVEAARALVDWAVENLGATRFIAHCDSENLASARVMEKLGMVRTDSAGVRKNRGSDALRTEYAYALTVSPRRPCGF